jgi:hypothetical protein
MLQVIKLDYLLCDLKKKSRTEQIFYFSLPLESLDIEIEHKSSQFIYDTMSLSFVPNCLLKQTCNENHELIFNLLLFSSPVSLPKEVAISSSDYPPISPLSSKNRSKKQRQCA